MTPAFKGPGKPEPSDAPATEPAGGGDTGDSARSADKPPKPEGRKRTSRAGGGSSPGGGRSTSRASAQISYPQLEKRLEELFGAGALPFLMSGDAHCAQIVANGAAPLAHAWTNLAKESPAVRKVLNNLTQTSAWGEVIIATASVVIPIAAHHSSYIPDMGGIFGGGEGVESPNDNGGSPSSHPPATAPVGTPTATTDTPATREAAASQQRVPRGAAVSVPPTAPSE